jgi:hypothetical protein
VFGLWCAAHGTPASLLGTLPCASEPAEAGAVARRLRQRLGGADAPRAHGGVVSCDLDGDAMKAKFVTLAKKPKPVVVLAVAAGSGIRAAPAPFLRQHKNVEESPDWPVNSRRAVAI